MSFEISTIEVFDRQAKRLSKHYASFRDDYKSLLEMLRKNPMAGADLGDGIRKVRMAITSKGKGKSGGARVITYTADVITVSCEGELLLLSIYDKSEYSTISDKEIKRLKKLAEAHKQAFPMP
jgi:hypothetical protein